MLRSHRTNRLFSFQFQSTFGWIYKNPKHKSNSVISIPTMWWKFNEKNLFWIKSSMFVSLRQFGKCDAADDKKCVFARHRNVNMFRLSGGSSDDDKRLIHVVRANDYLLVRTNGWKGQSDSECDCAIGNLPIENRLFQSLLEIKSAFFCKGQCLDRIDDKI